MKVLICNVSILVLLISCGSSLNIKEKSKMDEFLSRQIESDSSIFMVIIETDNLEDLKNSGIHLNSILNNYKATARLTKDELIKVIKLESTKKVKRGAYKKSKVN